MPFLTYKYSHSALLSEYSLKAAYLVNFAKFVDWEDNAQNVKNHQSNAFVFCIFGAEKVADQISTLQGKSLKGKVIKIRTTINENQPENCQIMYLGEDAHRYQDYAIQKVVHLGTLTVGESNDFHVSGGMIRLFVAEQHVRFSVNIAAIRESGLKVDAQLLSLAKDIINK